MKSNGTQQVGASGPLAHEGDALSPARTLAFRCLHCIRVHETVTPLRLPIHPAFLPVIDDAL